MSDDIEVEHTFRLLRNDTRHYTKWSRVEVKGPNGLSRQMWADAEPGIKWCNECVGQKGRDWTWRPAGSEIGSKSRDIIFFFRFEHNAQQFKRAGF